MDASNSLRKKCSNLTLILSDICASLYEQNSWQIFKDFDIKLFDNIVNASNDPFERFRSYMRINPYFRKNYFSSFVDLLNVSLNNNHYDEEHFNCNLINSLFNKSKLFVEDFFTDDLKELLLKEIEMVDKEDYANTPLEENSQFRITGNAGGKNLFKIDKNQIYSSVSENKGEKIIFRIYKDYSNLPRDKTIDEKKKNLFTNVGIKIEEASTHDYEVIKVNEPYEDVKYYNDDEPYVNFNEIESNWIEMSEVRNKGESATDKIVCERPKTNHRKNPNPKHLTWKKTSQFNNENLAKPNTYWKGMVLDSWNYRVKVNRTKSYYSYSKFIKDFDAHKDGIVNAILSNEKNNPNPTSKYRTFNIYWDEKSKTVKVKSKNCN